MERSEKILRAFYNKTLARIREMEQKDSKNPHTQVIYIALVNTITDLDEAFKEVDK